MKKIFVTDKPDFAYWVVLFCALVAVFVGCRGDDTQKGHADAGACWFDISEIDQHSWIPCPKQMPDPSIYGCHRDSGTVTVETCGQRQTIGWGWGTHGQTCFYEAGILVGLVMADDVHSFCDHTASFIEVGVTAGCPAGTPMVPPSCGSEGDTILDGGAVQVADSAGDGL